ncbi:hypothetical protein HYR69_06965, partial [Candidatus Sumerlaeota bacterium]|nr:hypothetical protein [Candidatus Sumerlaeota bacterium]
SGDLQRAIWGKADPPGSGFELNLDERAATLSCSGSKRHIEKLRDFLADLDLPSSTGGLETRIYKIRAQDGAKIKALVHALLASNESGVPAAERKIFVDGSDLMIRDTPENLAKFEALLTDKKFMGQMKNLKLTIVNFSLVPRDVEQGNPDQLQAFTSRVVEAVETFLYASEGKKAAAAQGRRLWYDPASMQLTVVDTPDRIAQVGRYLDSLPELKNRKHQRVMELDYAKAEDLAAELQEVLQAQKPSSSPAGGEETVKKLRRGDEFTFGDIRIRLMRVEPGDPNDRNDDECEININTGTQVNNISLRELDTIYFEDYEITAEDVQPAGGGSTSESGKSNRGEGAVRLRVRRIER